MDDFKPIPSKLDDPTDGDLLVHKIDFDQSRCPSEEVLAAFRISTMTEPMKPWLKGES